MNHTKNESNFKAGLVSRSNKWISISIDNSDLIILDHSPTESEEIHQDEVSSEKVFHKNMLEVESTSKTKFLNTQSTADPYLYLNFDIISRRSGKDPIQDHVNKKHVLSQRYRTPELSNRNFSQVPLQPSIKQPKEFGVRLGSSSKK